MAQLLFVTCDRWPSISQSDTLVANALIERGHRVEPVPWQGDFARLQAADLIILRSQWNYHYDMAGFAAWLEHVEAAALPVYNPVSLVRWNLHKAYLFDLHAREILIPTTHILQVGEAPEPIF